MNFFCQSCGLSKETMTVKNGNMICSECDAKEYVIDQMRYKKMELEK